MRHRRLRQFPEREPSAGARRNEAAILYLKPPVDNRIEGGCAPADFLAVTSALGVTVRNPPDSTARRTLENAPNLCRRARAPAATRIRPQTDRLAESTRAIGNFLRRKRVSETRLKFSTDDFRNRAVIPFLRAGNCVSLSKGLRSILASFRPESDLSYAIPIVKFG